MSDPATHVRLNIALLIVWMLLGIPTLLWWRESIFWIVLMSWYAIVSTHLAGVMAAKAEQKVDES